MKEFSLDEANILEEIITQRRDVRGNHFIDKEIPAQALDKILFAGVNAPSVGFSQPWEFVIIKDKRRKQAIKESFTTQNKAAQQSFDDEKQKKYAALKLEGIEESPINIAVFYKPSKGPILGQNSMQEVGLYSVVCAVQNMWLMARSLNIGIGWVSILDPIKVKEALNAPKDHQLVAYLCVGYVDEFYSTPELEIKKWEKRKDLSSLVFSETY